MKSLIPIFFLFNLSLADEKCQHDKTSFRCVEYVRNYDADTITFNIPEIHPLLGEKISVRVAGIDTPEIKTKNICEKNRAQESQKIVEQMMKTAKRIDLIKVERDKYFRILADVMVDGKSLSDQLLIDGHAYVYGGGKKKKMDWCRSSREIAVENKR